ncbi:MAG: CPBP family intramembrane metalloprotease [Bacteroidota bacterium]|nr:CPBP family intramembrane metalloprotease [Bacteroidota bacterium]
MTVDRNSKNISYPAQLGMFLGFIGAGLILGAIVSVAIWIMTTGRPLLSMTEDMLKPQYYYAILAIQAISTFFMFFVPVYLFAAICYRKPSRYLGFNTNINYKQFFLVIGILILTFFLSGALGELNNILPIPKEWAIKFKAMEDARAVQEAALININSFPKYIISLLLIGVLPGIFEELCFRAGLQNILIRWFKGPWVAIIITGIIFSLIHLSYYGFLVRFALGVILGFVFYYSGNIWLSILFHFLYNGIQVTALYVITLSEKKSPKDVEQSFPLWVGVIALLLIIYLFRKFKEFSAIEKAKEVQDDLPDDDFHNWATAQS